MRMRGWPAAAAAVDDLADAGEEVFVGLGDIAADDDDAGVEEVHGGGEDLAEVAAGFADEAHGFGSAVADEADDVAAVSASKPESVRLAARRRRRRWLRGSRSCRSGR